MPRLLYETTYFEIETNRHVPNGMHGGVRGELNLPYSIIFIFIHDTMEIENSCTMKTAFEICDNMQLLTLEKGNEVMAMSSIAYITNHEMIEYHRSHGSSEIVFWRFSGQRKFQNFNHGDYLFFLNC